MSESPSTRHVTRSRWHGSWADRAELFVPIGGYVLAALSGATSSSLGFAWLREDPSRPLGRTLGMPLGIRSDEWLVASPIEVGMIAGGHAETSTMAYPPDFLYQLTSGQPVESLMFFESNLLRLGAVLPEPILFAAYRNLPLLLLLLTLPPLLRRLGANRPLSWLAVVLTVLAPATVWWSFVPARIMSVAATGCYALVVAHERWGLQRRAPFYAALGGVMLARLITYYVPWSLTIGLPLVIVTGVWLLTRPNSPRRAAWFVIGIGALVGAATLGGTVLENLDAVRAELGTAYPAARRTSGLMVPKLMLFAAPGLFETRRGDVAYLNHSEISTAYTVTLPWTLALLALIRPRWRRREWAVVGSLTAVSILWFSRMTLDWGPMGDRVPLLNLVPPIRVAQTMGYSGAIVLVLVLGRLQAMPRWVPPTVAAVVGGLTYWSLVGLRPAVPTLWGGSLVLAAGITGGLAWAITQWRERTLPIVAATAACAIGSVLVNPVTFGLGDLRASQAARTVQGIAAVARSEGTLVATDQQSIGALLVANAVPTLTGYQTTGPNRSRWALLDPSGQAEGLWNRGVSYVMFDLSGEPGSAPAITNPTNDTIRIRVDPCSVVTGPLQVRRLATRQRLGSCLRVEQTFTWEGTPVFVYVPAT